MSLLSTIRFLSPQSWQNAVLSWVSLILGTGKTLRGLNLMNTVDEAWLRCCFWPKNYEQAMMSEQVKIQQFWNELRCHTLQTHISEKIAWHEPTQPTDMPISSATSLIVIRRFSITIFFTASVFIGCWRAGPSRASVVIHLFSTFCEELVPLINTFLTYSTLTVCHFQHFKCFWALKVVLS